MKKLLLTAVLLSCSLSAQAQTVWSCFAKNGKQILVTQEGANYRYHFGKAGNWELVFDNPLSQVKKQSTEHWDGQGRYGWSMMNMRNHGYNFGFSKSWDRMSGEHELSMSLKVSPLKGNGRSLTIDCDMSRPAAVNWDSHFD